MRKTGGNNLPYISLFLRHRYNLSSLFAPAIWSLLNYLHGSLTGGITVPDTTVKPGPTNVPNAYLLYNEYICYDISQVRLRYLLRVRM